MIGFGDRYFPPKSFANLVLMAPSMKLRRIIFNPLEKTFLCDERAKIKLNIIRTYPLALMLIATRLRYIVERLG